MATYLDFEKPIAELEARIAELRETAIGGASPTSTPRSRRLEERSARLLRDTYAKLTPWQKAQVARHPERPHFSDYVAGLVEDFVPLAGDRDFADDQRDRSAASAASAAAASMLIGHEKGDDTASRLKHNFGMAKPEGYRKAIRLMRARRPVRPAGGDAGRHAGRLSRRPGRGARPGRGDRPLDREMPRARRADGRRDRRRGRVGRRDRRSPPPTAC